MMEPRKKAFIPKQQLLLQLQQRSLWLQPTNKVPNSLLSSSLDDFSNFAASLEEDSSSSSRSTLSNSINGDKTAAFAFASATKKTTSTSTTTTTTTARSTSTTTTTTNNSNPKTKSWQDDLEELLFRLDTTPARRQILLQQLINANQDIRKSVETALQQRNIDPLLTPTGKRLQDGTRAVARQLSNDILPRVLASSIASNGARSRRPFPLLLLPPPPPPVVPPAPADLTKVGSRIWNALQNQIQQNLETLQSDLADPSRIPQRLSQQTTELVKEASNVFLETPVGLQEPPYTVVAVTEDYEIRDYEAQTCAVTKMRLQGEETTNRKSSSPTDNPQSRVDSSFANSESYYYYDADNIAESGAAFNSLAAYLFGANKESRAMSMTTPVTTTFNGEMRFYLADNKKVGSPTSVRNFPEPLEQDESKSVYETGSISIEEIPAARLAVRKFTGFCTSGEISRQKQTLLAALELDDIALDVPHGQTVGHVVFQYNPPYTIPVLRRNEIAVPVVSDIQRQEDEWQAATADDEEDDDYDESAWESAPSD